MQISPLLFANPRGKLGGFVASRNSFGDYLREFVVPIQPNTPAQLGAKTAFGVASTTWRGLSASEKQIFESFARTTFQPRNKTNRGQYSGQLAFNAIFIQFLNSQRINRAFEVQRESVVLPGGITTAPFESPLLATLSSLLTPSYTDGNGNPQVGSIIAGTMDFMGGFSFTMQMGNGAGFDFSSFQIAGAGATGFAVYASSANPVAGMNFRNMEKYLLGYLEAPSFVVPSEGDDSENFTMQTLDILNTLDYQNFPAGNDFVNLSIYAVSNTCQSKLIGRVEVQINPTP